MKNMHLIKKRSPESVIQELKAELTARIEDCLLLVKDIRSPELDNLRARCKLYAYEDIVSLLLSMEEEEDVEFEPTFVGWNEDDRSNEA